MHNQSNTTKKILKIDAFGFDLVGLFKILFSFLVWYYGGRIGFVFMELRGDGLARLRLAGKGRRTIDLQ